MCETYRTLSPHSFDDVHGYPCFATRSTGKADRALGSIRQPGRVHSDMGNGAGPSGESDALRVAAAQKVKIFGRKKNDYYYFYLFGPPKVVCLFLSL